MRSRTLVLTALTAVMILGLGFPALAGPDAKKDDKPAAEASKKPDTKSAGGSKPGVE